MFAVVVTLQIRPGEMPAFLSAVRRNARASLDEPACTRFDVLTDPDRPDEVLLYELYDDAAGFDAHRATDHYATFTQIATPLIAAKDVRAWREVQR